jgi:hypothetical protein
MVVTLQEGLIAMRVFKDIERVVRTSERSVALKRKKKEDTVLKRRLALLVLEGRAVTVRDEFDYETETRAAEGQPPLSLGEELRAIEEHNGSVVFTVTGSELRPSINFDITTNDNLYWFNDDGFGEIECKSMEIAPAPTELGHWYSASVYNDAPRETGNTNMTFLFDLRLPKAEFERLFQKLWLGRGQSQLRVVLNVVCFQEPLEAAYNDWFPNNLLFEVGGPIPVKLKSIHAEQATLAPANFSPIIVDEDESLDEQEDLSNEEYILVTIRRVHSTMKGIEKMLWWTVNLVGVIAVILVLYYLL